MEEFNTNQDPNDDRDPKTIELCKKQHVNVKGHLIEEDINCKICDLGNPHFLAIAIDEKFMETKDNSNDTSV